MLSKSFISLVKLFINFIIFLTIALGIISMGSLKKVGKMGAKGSGFIVLASKLSAINVIPIKRLAMLLGVDRFMSEARAITNFIGNGVATIWLANKEGEFDRNKMK